MARRRRGGGRASDGSSSATTRCRRPWTSRSYPEEELAPDQQLEDRVADGAEDRPERGPPTGQDGQERGSEQDERPVLGEHRPVLELGPGVHQREQDVRA